MSKTNDFHNIVFALEQMESELPSIVGDEIWANLGAEYRQKLKELRQSSDESQKALLATELMSMIWKYPKANEYFQIVRNDTNLIRRILLELASMGKNLGLDEKTNGKLMEAATQPESQHRVVVIKPGGIGKTKTIKLNNLEFDFGEFSELVAGTILSIKDIIGETNYIYIAAGILLIVTSLYKATIKEISEEDATVFWGFIQVNDKDKQASEEEILMQANAERMKLGLSLLSGGQVKHSLIKLQLLKSVRSIDSSNHIWQIVEKYRINM